MSLTVTPTHSGWHEIKGDLPPRVTEASILIQERVSPILVLKIESIPGVERVYMDKKTFAGCEKYPTDDYSVRVLSIRDGLRALGIEFLY